MGSEDISNDINGIYERNPRIDINKDDSMDISGTVSALEKEITGGNKILNARHNSTVIENQAS